MYGCGEREEDKARVVWRNKKRKAGVLSCSGWTCEIPGPVPIYVTAAQLSHVMLFAMLLRPAAGGRNPSHHKPPFLLSKKSLQWHQPSWSHDHGCTVQIPSVPEHPSLQMLGKSIDDEFNHGGTMFVLCFKPSTAVWDIHDHKTSSRGDVMWGYTAILMERQPNRFTRSS